MKPMRGQGSGGSPRSRGAGGSQSPGGLWLEALSRSARPVSTPRQAQPQARGKSACFSLKKNRMYSHISPPLWLMLKSRFSDCLPAQNHVVRQQPWETVSQCFRSLGISGSLRHGGSGGLASCPYPTTNFPWNLWQIVPLKASFLSCKVVHSSNSCHL